jgi:hypothetical protein
MSETDTKNTNGNKQRNKIPRTTQIKRLYRSGMPSKALSLKAWAKVENEKITRDWLFAKGIAVKA